jgi:hypothetical protein
MPRSRIRIALAVVALLFTLLPSSAAAFDHIVQKGETLASIAEKYYGRIQFEKLLVAANALDAQGGSPIVRGMRLEVPALGHRRVKPGDTWAVLAEELLGAADRSDVLSLANDSSPWLTPETGAEIVVPYNLRVLVSQNDTITGLSYKFLGDRNKAWIVDRYNALKGRRLVRGDVVLIALTDLPLTAAGKAAATRAAGAACTESMGETRAAQRKVQAEIPALIADVKSGRYVDAVSRGVRFLGSGSLTQGELAKVHRQLLEAYAALDAVGLAAAACSEWRKADPAADLSPTRLSPKLLTACARSLP